MLLQGKEALVFAATGAISSEVARTFAQEGAQIWLSGRRGAALEKLAQAITDAGGQAQVNEVDAADPQAVAAYVQHVAQRAGRIDVVFNGIGARPADLAYPALSTTQELADFFKPLHLILGSQFLTARTAAVLMMEQGGGSIVTLSATLSGMAAGLMAKSAPHTGLAALDVDQQASRFARLWRICYPENRPFGLKATLVLLMGN